jgi:ElaB/YqjD/DUF883 family membrane-anchored ribosome-binding protein
VTCRFRDFKTNRGGQLPATPAARRDASPGQAPAGAAANGFGWELWQPCCHSHAGENVMTNVLEETAVENRVEAKMEPPACCIPAHDMAKQIGKTVHVAQTAVSEALQDGKETAEHLWDKSRIALNECAGETARSIRKHPFASVMMAAAAGAVLGLIMPRAWRLKKYIGARDTNYGT